MQCGHDCFPLLSVTTKLQRGTKRTNGKNAIQTVNWGKISDRYITITNLGQCGLKFDKRDQLQL